MATSRPSGAPAAQGKATAEHLQRQLADQEKILDEWKDRLGRFYQLLAGKDMSRLDFKSPKSVVASLEDALGTLHQKHEERLATERHIKEVDMLNKGNEKLAAIIKDALTSRR